MELIERVQLRLQGENPDTALLQELISTASDRLCIRLGEDSLPVLFESICVDAVVKMYRRMYYEGVSSENGGNLSTSFVEDVLNEYAEEIDGWNSRKANTSGSGKVVHFL